MYGPYLVKCHACGKTYAWTPIERACTFCGAPSTVDKPPPKKNVRSLDSDPCDVAVLGVATGVEFDLAGSRSDVFACDLNAGGG